MSREFKNKRIEAEKDAGPELIEKVVHINRCAKVVKGGRRFTFSALVVIGDGKGNVGLGYGKAKEVPDAIKKASDRARKVMKPVSLKDNTIPPGTGVIAGGGVRAVLEAVGIKDVLSKSLGSNNDMAMVNATLDALYQLRTAETISAQRS